LLIGPVDLLRNGQGTKWTRVNLQKIGFESPGFFKHGEVSDWLTRLCVLNDEIPFTPGEENDGFF
jgi:hypothetical protein